MDNFNFNPRSRVGNDVKQAGMQVSYFISIHVPAWGTTTKTKKYDVEDYISIHVPAWGTTLCAVEK